MRVPHPLVPLGALVGFAWIVAIAVAVRSCKPGSPSGELADLVHRMCACRDRACIDEVDREAAQLTQRMRDSWGGETDALETFGVEQDLQACRREALKRLR